MKKLIGSVVISMTMAIMVGCGGGEDNAENNQPQNQSQPQDQNQQQSSGPQRVAKLESRPSNATCLAPDNTTDIATLLSDTGCFSDTATQTVAAGVIPYTVNSILWSDGESKGRYFAIPDGTTIKLTGNENTAGLANGIKNADFDYPVGSVVIKNFYSGDRIVETRFLMKHSQDYEYEPGLFSQWGAYSYRWNSEQTDATLLSDSFSMSDPVSHYFPSRQECMQCHPEDEIGGSVKVVLGTDALQLNYELYYTDGTQENYLDALDRLGYFDVSPLSEYKQDRLYAIDDETASLEQRARSYLHSNCSGCHRAGGPNGGVGDMRYNSSFSSNVCGVPPNELDSPGTALIEPGEPRNSTVYRRIAATNDIMMPPVGRETADTEAVSLIRQWIEGLADCQ